MKSLPPSGTPAPSSTAPSLHTIQRPALSQMAERSPSRLEQPRHWSPPGRLSRRRPMREVGPRSRGLLFCELQLSSQIPPRPHIDHSRQHRRAPPSWICRQSSRRQPSPSLQPTFSQPSTQTASFSSRQASSLFARAKRHRHHFIRAERHLHPFIRAKRPPPLHTRNGALPPFIRATAPFLLRNSG